ncbi:MAG TPA: energy transducer TonB [Pyrinomonadaceae bacterium]
MKRKVILSLMMMFALLVSPAAAQSTAGEMKTFAKDGLSFSYPAGWRLTDKSNEQAQHLVLSQPNSSIIIMVVAYRELLTNGEQLSVGVRNITEPYIESIVKNFAASKQRVERDNPCIEIGGVKVSGTRLRGVYQNEPSAGEVYAFLRVGRFVNLIYIRADKDAPRGDAAWDAVYKSVTIEGQNDFAGLLPDNVVSGGVLNGKALSLPKPEYSSFARGARASGTVIVMVTIDEKGSVTSAKAVSGHPLLHKSAEDAALRAKFSPTSICGQPLKVTGTISYHFALWR